MTGILKENLQWKQSFNWTEIEQVGAFHLAWASFLNLYSEKAYSCCLSTKLDWCFDATHFYAPVEQKWKLSIISLAIQVYAHLHSNLYKNLFHTSLLREVKLVTENVWAFQSLCATSSHFLLSGKRFYFGLYSKNGEEKKVRTLNTFSVPVSARLRHWRTCVTRNQKLLFSGSPACSSVCSNKRM